MTSDRLAARARALGLWGLLANWEAVRDTDWLPTVLEMEDRERGDRSLQRRMKNARLGRFKPIADFDWDWAQKVDRKAVEGLFDMTSLRGATNVVLVGPNGVGKTMVAKNLAHRAVLQGATALFITAADMLGDLAAQESASARQRRLKRYVQPRLLVVDEVGYLSYDSTHADLLFEVVNRRYEHAPVVLTTNRPFSEWNEVFPNSSCVVTLVDRLVHDSEILSIQADSYRLKEAQERAAHRQQARRKA